MSPGLAPATLFGDHLMKKMYNSTAGISPALDAAGNIKRDADGNALDSSGKPMEVSLLQELIDLAKKQLNVIEQDSVDTKLQNQKNDAIAAKQNSVKEHMDNLAGQYRTSFTVPN